MYNYYSWLLPKNLKEIGNWWVQHNWRGQELTVSNVFGFYGHYNSCSSLGPQLSCFSLSSSSSSIQFSLASVQKSFTFHFTLFVICQYLQFSWKGFNFYLTRFRFHIEFELLGFLVFVFEVLGSIVLRNPFIKELSLIELSQLCMVSWFSFISKGTFFKTFSLNSAHEFHPICFADNLCQTLHTRKVFLPHSCTLLLLSKR